MAARTTAPVDGNGRRLNAQEQWLKASEPTPVSLDPEKAVKRELVHWPPDAEHPVFVIEQKRQPPNVQVDVSEGAKCRCGKRLHGCASELLIEGFVAAIWFKGMCFSCGWQESLCPISWQRPTDEQLEMVEEIYEQRRSVA